MSSFRTFLFSALGSVFGFFVVIVAGLIVIPGLIALVLQGGFHRGKNDSVKPKSVLHLDLRGTLTDKHKPMDFDLLGDRSIFSEDRTMGLFELNKAIDLAKNDKRISGIYLDLHDFEAGWAGATALRRHIEDFAKSGKWVYAYADHMDEMGYYLATAAKEIYMEPYGDLEFNGLAMQEMFYKGLLDKLEVQPLVFRVGKFKAAVEPLIRENMSPENREQTQAMMDDFWAQVRTASAKIPALTPARIDEIANNLEVTSSESAKKAGLIQELLFADAVEDKLRDMTVGKDNELQLVTPIQYLHDAPAEKKHSGKKIALIFAEGEIHSGESGRDSIGSEGLREDIIDAKSDDDVAAIVLRVNSPGGDALASDVIWRELRETDDEVPVVISMGDLAASGGYYISSAGRYIFAEPTTITGSIGVFGLMFNGEKALKTKAGITFDRVVTHAHADIGSYSRPMSPMEAKSIQSDVDRVYKRFLDVVQEGRGYEKRGDLESIAEGRVWSGTRAKDLGLVDELGGLDQAIAKAADYAEIKDYKLEIFPSETDPLRHLLEKFTGEAMSRISIKALLGGGVLGQSVQDLQGNLQGISPLRNRIYARMPYDMKIH